MTSVSAASPNADLRHRGPSVLVVAIVFTTLFIASLVVSTVMAGGSHFPSPFQPGANRYFSDHATAVRTGAFLQFGSAIPLGIFTATAVSQLRFLGVDVAGRFIALFGGIAASLMLALSALVQWVLSQAGVAGPDATVHALHTC